jgi:hypothetical protein
VNIEHLTRKNTWRMYTIAGGAGIGMGLLFAHIYAIIEPWIFSLPLVLAFIPPLVLAYLIGWPISHLLSALARRLHVVDTEAVIFAALLAGLLVFPAMRFGQYVRHISPAMQEQARHCRALHPEVSTGACLVASWKSATRAYSFHQFLEHRITAFPDAIDPDGVIKEHHTFGWLFWLMRVVVCCASCLSIPLTLLLPPRGDDHMRWV